jgi:hypothetical protein
LLIARWGGWGRGREEDVIWGAGREKKGICTVATSSATKKQLKGKFRNKTERKKDWIRKEERDFGNHLPLLGYTEYEDDKSTKKQPTIKQTVRRTEKGKENGKQEKELMGRKMGRKKREVKGKKMGKRKGAKRK